MQSPSRKPWLRVTAVMLLMSLGACKTMDREECIAADWQTIGFEDGVAGYSADRIAEHRKACAEYGIAPDLVGYQAGRTEGLREYCVPANGFRVGAQGSSYSGVCPADMDNAFTDAYQTGRQLYTLQTRVSNVNSDLYSRREDLRHAESDIVKRSARAISSDASSDERAQAVVDVKQLGEYIGRLKTEIDQLEAERLRSERDLEDYRATLPFNP